MGAPQLPIRFPCWCRAVFSWGGETKRDLGFIEGDLIECLNAGDGAWWMGRLRRDPRAIGLFPSNFVKVLDESFQPAHNSRNASPLPSHSSISSPNEIKTKQVFRKPFQAYQEIGKGSSGATMKETMPPSNAKEERKQKQRPFASMRTSQAPGSVKKSVSPVKGEEWFRVPSPPPRGGAQRPSSRAVSPMPQTRGGAGASPTPMPMYRAASPAPSFRSTSPNPQAIYRAPSPAPSDGRPHTPLPGSYHDGSAYPQLLPPSRGPSPAPQEDNYQHHSTAAPPAPQHDFYNQSRAPSPAPSFEFHHHSRAPSPAPFEEDVGSSPPPPPPPAHRVAYQPSRAPSPQPYQHEGMRTPIPPSPSGGSHMTPSPLRDAMNDVMTSLQDMSVLQDPSPTREERPPNMWSPEAFEQVRTQSRQQRRAQSSYGFTQHQSYDNRSGEDSRTPSLPSSRDGPPVLGTYVQRMEQRLRHAPSSSIHHSSSFDLPDSQVDHPPAPPLKGSQYPPATRPPASSSTASSETGSRFGSQRQKLKHRKSAYELGREALNRTFTTKTNATNSTESSSGTQGSNSTQLTSRSIMSGYSAGGFSATSAGSLARRKFGMGSLRSRRGMSVIDTHSNIDMGSSARSIAESRPGTSVSGISYHESHASRPALTPTADWMTNPMESAGVLGGLGAPKAKKSGFFKKMIATARTGAASARSTIGSGSGSLPNSRAGSPTKSLGALSGISGGSSRPGSAFGRDAGRGTGLAGSLPFAAMDVGPGAGSDWMQVRRDVNRSNSLSRNERNERAERCEMLDIPVLNPIDILHEQAEGDEGLDGLPITEPVDFNTPNLALVDKSTRFITSVPPMSSGASLAQGYICRPHRSDVQRLRAIFTWAAERIAWDDGFEGDVDTRRVISSKRGCAREIAALVQEMCKSVGLHAETVRGYLRSPGEAIDLDTLSRPNHWWNAVIVDGEWRIMDCSLAAPTHPHRSNYSAASSQVAEPFYFLARPMEICYTHIPLLPEQQHVLPPIDHEILVALPCAAPPYFKNKLELAEFDTSLLHLENLEMCQVHIWVPEDVECIAEVEAKAYARDGDGDFFESGDIVRERALAQAEWIAGRKRITVKALLPGDEGQGTLKVYAGKRGLMHSIKDNPHGLALALPLTHTGQNPPYDFLTRHPTPHAQRHDLYVAQPQCARLVVNNTFVFSVRQHPSALSRFSPDTWGSSANGRPPSPNPSIRPTSAMSMISTTASVSHSSYSDNSNPASGGPMTSAQQKPAKLAIQSPSQKIIRLTRKHEHMLSRTEQEAGLSSVWETVIKVGERGTWRGLVLADRSARWCVFAEWTAV